MTVEPANIHSQFGEDAILAAIFAELQIEQGYLLEVGAWDGIHLSNCRALLEKGWTGVHIEAEQDRAQELARNVEPFGSHAICALAGPAGTPLTRLLEDAHAHDNFNFVSIDIDSDDLALFEEFTATRSADVICVEYNPSVPNDVRFRNTPGNTWGNSALSLCESANARGYRLVAFTACNLIFVADVHAVGRYRLYDLTGDPAPGHIRLWWGYDGSLFSYPLAVANDLGNITPADVVHPSWGQVGFPQPVPAAARTWPAP